MKMTMMVGCIMKMCTHESCPMSLPVGGRRYSVKLSAVRQWLI